MRTRAEGGRDRLAFATVASGAFLPSAQVLERSLREHHPEIPFFLLLADRQRAGSGVEAGTAGGTIGIESLAIPDLPELAFRFTAMGLAVVAKECIVRHLFDKGFERVFFLDADLLALARLDPLIDALDTHDLVLSPHHLAPLAGSDRVERERTILRAGAFNGGLYGVADQPDARAFLAWWRERLRLHSVHDVDRGLHHDQRWLDLTPGFVARLGIVRDPGINVAYWNLPERPLALRDGVLTAAESRLRLFHFSGFDPRDPERLSRHHPGLSTEELGPGAAMVHDYARKLLQAGWGDAVGQRHGWADFDDGTPIPALARTLYRELGDDIRRFGNPFRSGGEGTFFHWLAQPGEDDPDRERPIPRIWRKVHATREDLRRAFPDPLGRDRTAFLAWTAASGLVEHDVPPSLLAPGVR